MEVEDVDENNGGEEGYESDYENTNENMESETVPNLEETIFTNLKNYYPGCEITSSTPYEVTDGKTGQIIQTMTPYRAIVDERYESYTMEQLKSLLPGNFFEAVSSTSMNIPYDVEEVKSLNDELTDAFQNGIFNEYIQEKIANITTVQTKEKRKRVKPRLYSEESWSESKGGD